MNRWFRLAGLVLLIALAVWADRTLDLSWTAVVERARGVVEPLGAWGPVAFIGLCVVAALIHAPEIVLIALGGVLFGKLGGFVYGWIGGVAGGALCFLLARYLLRDLVQPSLIRRFGALQRLDSQLERHGFLTVTALRLLLFLAPPMNWAIGTTSVRFSHYLAGSIVGVIPGLAITVTFADALTQVGSPRELARPEVLVPAALIAGFLVFSSLAFRRVLSGRKGAPPAAAPPSSSEGA